MRYAMCIIGLMGLLGWKAADAEEPSWWAVATVRSYHFDRSRPHNEDNYGPGIEYHPGGDWSFSAGYYDNSFYRRTSYLGARYDFDRHGPWALGITTSIVTGYTPSPKIIPLPAFTYEGKQFGFNIGFSPNIIGLQVKMKVK